MRTVQTLIAECIERCNQSQTALAKRLGISKQALSAMYLGTMPVSPATVGMLCDVIELDGEEARRLAVLAIVANAKPEKRGVLRRAFFVCLGAGATFGAAAMLSLLSWSDAQAKIVERNRGTDRPTVYTLSCVKNQDQVQEIRVRRNPCRPLCGSTHRRMTYRRSSFTYGHRTCTMTHDPIIQARWRTSSFASPPDTSPAELAELGEHLRRCQLRRGTLFGACNVANTLNRFLASRFVSTLVIAAVLTVAACVTL